MPNKFDRRNSRYEQRAKRRKTNIILNTLIAIVVILILVVGGSIFLTDSKTEKQMKEAAKTEAQLEKKQQAQKQSEQEDKQNDKKEENKEADEPKDKEIVEKDSDEANVEKIIIDPSWEPVGTEQTAGHQSSWEMGSTDWNEKEKAAAYAIGISPDNMTNWWTKGGENPDNQAVMTVSESSKPDEAYRVYLDWVDGEGWKPTEVKKLITNDKGKE